MIEYIVNKRFKKHQRWVFGIAAVSTVIAIGLLVSIPLGVFSSPESQILRRLERMHVGVYCNPANRVTAYFRCRDEYVFEAVGLVSQYVAYRKANLTRVEVLDPIGDQGLQLIVKMRGVTELMIHARAITNSAMLSVAEVPNLRVLVVTCPLVDCAGIKEFTAIDSLEQLYLVESGVTDDCLPLLATLPRLQVVSVFSTRVTKAGVESLKRIRPDVSIAHESHRDTVEPPETTEGDKSR